MDFRLPRKKKKELKKLKWIDILTGEVKYPWNSQLDYKEYKSGKLKNTFIHINPSI